MSTEQALVPTQATATVDVFGTCFETPERIRELVQRGELAALTAFAGSYSLAIRQGATVVLAGAGIGPSNLFYAHTPAGFFYSTNVIDLLKQARIAWRWNWTALADMTALDHCVDGDTLHADVRKLMPGTAVSFDGSQLRCWRVPWAERMERAAASPQGALQALLESCERYSRSGDLVVSMSAGFDSRLLLACLLAVKAKPRLITMGLPASTDVRVAAAIARRFDLEFETAPLRATTYTEAAGDIIRITSGSKGFQHWHTYAYASNARLRKTTPVFIGANGEAARSYYLDRGLAALAAEAAASEITKRALWTRKLRPIFAPDELRMLHPAFDRQFAAAGIEARAQRLLALSPGALLKGLDHFYTEQRVSNFIVNGLSLVGAHAQVAAPMLDQAWMSHVWNLPRSWKMDSRWHRFAIAKLCPALLAFENERTGKPMGAAPRAFYWVPLPGRRRQVVPYVDYAELLRTEPILTLVAETRSAIDSLGAAELPSLIFDRHRTGVGSTRAAAFALTMLFLIRRLRSEGIRISAD